MLDVSGILSGNKVSLEKTAFDLFAAQVETFGNRNSNPAVLRGPLGTYVPPTTGQFTGSWDAQNYAGFLVDYAPKHRFMFKIEFVFNPSYINTSNMKDPNAFTYVIKQIDRPTVSFEYEPVNFYNFRTKVLKSIDHRPLNMQFYDDIQNSVLNFFNQYRKAYSPISRIWTPLAGKNTKYFQEHGMDFTDPLSDPESGGDYYTSSVGVLANEQYNVLDAIRIHQIYAHGSQVNTFTFVNPRILEFDFDDIDHEGGNGNMMSVQFEYDALSVTSFATKDTNMYYSPVPDILGHGAAATYPQGVMGPPGPTFNKPPTIIDQFIKGATNMATSAVSNQVQKMVGGTLGGSAGGLGYVLGNMASGQARNTIGGAVGTVNQSFARPAAPVVTDSALTPQEAGSNTKILY